MAYTKYSLTPSNNTATPPDGAPEGMLPSAVNDTMRDMMAQIRDCGDGIRDGTYTMTAPKITGGTITGVAFTGNTFTSPVISGGSINNTPIGATTANTGAFTTLSATGVTTVQAGTNSAPAITTSGDTNTGIFFPAADTIAFTEGGVESMRIDSSGNVGIGTSSPQASLHVAGTIGGSPTGNGMLAGMDGNNACIQLNGSDGAIIDFSASGVNRNGRLLYNNASNYLAIDVNQAERMRIDSSGNLLVGTTTAIRKLTVSGEFATTDGTTQVRIGQSGGVGLISTLTNHAMAFQTNDTERMRIDSSGNLCLGQTSADGKFTSNAANASQRSIHAGQLNSSPTTDGIYYSYANTTFSTNFNFCQYQTNSGIAFRVFGNGNVVNANNSYGSTSDIKLKENIADASPKLDKLMNVKVRTYNLIGDTQKQIGVIAQEIEQIFPSIIEEAPDRDADGNVLETTTKSVKYSVFVPMLIKSIQELNAKVEAQAAEIALLKSK